MDKTTIEQLNSAAMQIILHAGDCRNLLNEAINDLLDDKSEEEVKDKITQAKKEITKAHVIQTDMIQSFQNLEIHSPAGNASESALHARSYMTARSSS